MTERYYTPDIEEFHVGFICEMNTTPNNWVKTSITLNHFPHLNKWLLENHIRVKYLDREDIESLGFNYNSKTLPKSDFNFYKKIDEIQICRLSVYWGMSTPQQESLIRIYMGTDRELPHTEVFRGEIKNESELRKLLKQLGIK